MTTTQPAQPTPSSTFQQVTRPAYPTAGEVESYRVDAHEAGMADAHRFVMDGSPMLAFLSVVRATEAEAQVLGLGRVDIPTLGGLGRLPYGRAPRRTELAS